jgi:hypothetical protein
VDAATASARRRRVFKQFSFQRFSRSLTEFDMAAWQIPDVRVPLATWRAVAQEDPTVLDHHAGHDRLSHRQIVDPHRETHDLRSECLTNTGAAAGTYV